MRAAAGGADNFVIIGQRSGTSPVRRCLSRALFGTTVITDDLAPVEDLIDRILLDYARKGGS